MSMYIKEQRFCKICDKRYEANVLVSSNTFSQSHESVMEEFKRHEYWLCDDCWELNHNKPDNELEIYIPYENDFVKLKSLIKTEDILIINKSQRFTEYSKSLEKYDINYDIYTSYLQVLMSCLSTEIIAQNKPYKLYIDYKELSSDSNCVEKTIGYLFDPKQKGPNISISYNLNTYSGNLFHMFPKIIVDSGYKIHISHAEKTMVSKMIYGHGFPWNIDVEMHKKIRELLKNSYSWMKNNYISNNIQYIQHIYFSTDLISDLLRTFDKYYDVFGKPFEKIRGIATQNGYGQLNENLEITYYQLKSEMRLLEPPFTDVKY